MAVPNYMDYDPKYWEILRRSDASVVPTAGGSMIRYGGGLSPTQSIFMPSGAAPAAQGASGGGTVTPTTGTLGAVGSYGTYTPATPPAGSITPAGAYDYSAAAGGKPYVPDVGFSQGQAIQANIGNLPSLQNLAQATNLFNLGQRTAQYEAGIPGYSGMVAQSAANILASLKGELPTSVKEQLQTAAAERGIAGGMPGSQFAGYDYLRSLGLSSLSEQQRGEQNLSSAIARMPQVNLYDPSKMYVSPQEQYQSQLLANLYAAAPVPEAAQQRAIQLAQAGLASGYSAVPRSNVAATAVPSTAATWTPPSLASMVGQAPSTSRLPGGSGYNWSDPTQAALLQSIFGTPGTGYASGPGGSYAVSGGEIVPVTGGTSVMQAGQPVTYPDLTDVGLQQYGQYTGPYAPSPVLNAPTEDEWLYEFDEF